MTKDAKYRFLSKLERLAEALCQRGDSVSMMMNGKSNEASCMGSVTLAKLSRW